MAEFTPVGVEAIVKGLGGFTSDLNRMNGLVSQTGSFTNQAAGSFALLGSNISGVGIAAGVATAGVAALGAGIAAMASAGISRFAELDNSMREVWTLLPDVGGQAMAELTQDVLSLSAEMGRLSSQTVPALYQALSAGVPQDNVLDFLTTANKAAVAGVTDLKTAVDGLTTVVNAYGEEVLGVTEASDIMFTAVRLGKCVTGDTRVLLSDGRYKRIDELQEGGEVVSFDGRTFVPMGAQWVEQGTKPTVELQTRLGRKIVTTWNHPYLTENGWRKVSELSVGDRIAIPTALPFFGSREVPEYKAALLGLWLAEGATSSSSVRLTTSLYGEQIAEWAGAFGCTSRNVEKREGFTATYDITCGNRGGTTEASPVQQFLRDLGLGDVTSATKHIPEEVFSWDRKSVSILLHWLFNGDGWLADLRTSKRSGFQLGFASKSKQLVEDVSHLLLRFGIVGRVRKRRNCYVWEINRFAEIERFLLFIGIDRPVADVVFAHKPDKQRAMWGVIEYDPIVGIEPGVEKPVYDLMVPGLHNFVANDIVAHNTTFDELAKSAFNVVPIAASASVAFDEVAAAIAVLTQQGVPTSVATTQIRQALAELADTGSEVGKKFEEVAGISFREFTAAGGTMQDALLLLEQEAISSGRGLDELFGSVEAGQAALTLTGSGADDFNKALGEMRINAGATEEAAAKMEGGITRSFQRISAAWAEMQDRMSTLLAGPLAAFANWVESILPALTAKIERDVKVASYNMERFLAFFGFDTSGFATNVTQTMQAINDELNMQLDELTATHAERMAALVEQTEQAALALEQRLSDLAQQQAEELAEIEARHADRISSLQDRIVETQRQYNEQRAEAQRVLTQRLGDMEEDYAQTVERINKQLADELERYNQQREDATRSMLQQIERLEESHAQTVENINRQLAEELERYTDQRLAAEENYTEEVSRLYDRIENENEDLNAALLENKLRLEEELLAIDERYVDRYNDIQQRIEDINFSTSQQRERIEHRAAQQIEAIEQRRLERQQELQRQLAQATDARQALIIEQEIIANDQQAAEAKKAVEEQTAFELAQLDEKTEYELEKQDEALAEAEAARDEAIANAEEEAQSYEELLVERHAAAIAQLEAQIAEEAAMRDAQLAEIEANHQEQIAMLQERLAKEQEEHAKNLQRIEDNFNYEAQKNAERHAKAVADLQARLAQEQAEYEKNRARVQENFDRETQASQERYNRQLMQLQEELAKELEERDKALEKVREKYATEEQIARDTNARVLESLQARIAEENALFAAQQQKLKEEAAKKFEEASATAQKQAETLSESSETWYQKIWNSITYWVGLSWDYTVLAFQGIWDFTVMVFRVVWEWISEKSRGIWESISYWFGLAWDYTKEAFQGMWDFVSPIFAAIWSWIVEKSKAIWEGIKYYFQLAWEFVKMAFQGMWDFVGPIVATIWSWIVEKSKGIWETITDWIGKAWQFMKDAWQGIWDFVSPIVTNLWNWITEKAKAIWESITEWFGKAWDYTKEAFQGIWDKAGEIVGPLVDKFKTWWESIKNHIVDFMTTAKEKAVEHFTTIKDKGKELFTTLRDKIKELAEDIKNKIVDFINAAKDKAVEYFTTIRDKGKEYFTTLRDKIEEKAKQIRDAMSYFEELKDNVLAYFTTLVTDLPQNALDIYNSLVYWFNEARHEVTVLMETAKNDILGFLDPSLYYDAAVNLVTGFIDGLWSMAEELWTATMDVFTYVSDAMYDLFDFGSPSKVMKEFAILAARGFGIGFEDEAPKVEQTIRRAVSGIGAATMSIMPTVMPSMAPTVTPMSAGNSSTVNFGDVHVNNGMDQAEFQLAVEQAAAAAL